MTFNFMLCTYTRVNFTEKMVRHFMFTFISFAVKICCKNCIKLLLQIKSSLRPISNLKPALLLMKINFTFSNYI